MKTAAFVLVPGLAALLISGSVARADPDTSAPRALATMDWVGSNSEVAVDAAYTNFADDEFEEGLESLRFDLHGRYVHPSGFGVTAALPFSSVWLDGDNENAIGNLSIGGLYTHRSGSTEIFARAGVVLPTAEHEDGVYNAFAGFGRLADLMTGYPETTTLQLSVSPQFTSGRVFVRGDLGLDVVVDKPDDAGDGFGPLGHLSAAVGLDTGPVDIAAESVNEINFGDVGEDESRMIHTLGLSASYSDGWIRPHVGLALPVGKDLSDLVDFVVLAGVSGTIGG